MISFRNSHCNQISILLTEVEWTTVKFFNKKYKLPKQLYNDKHKREDRDHWKMVMKTTKD